MACPDRNRRKAAQPCVALPAPCVLAGGTWARELQSARTCNILSAAVSSQGCCEGHLCSDAERAGLVLGGWACQSNLRFISGGRTYVLPGPTALPWRCSWGAGKIIFAFLQLSCPLPSLCISPACWEEEGARFFLSRQAEEPAFPAPDPCPHPAHPCGHLGSFPPSRAIWA